MTSFGINSRFTNVPLDKTFDIIIKAFQNTTLYHGFSRLQLRKLLSLSVKNCHLLFNDGLYEQTDGVTMSSPLGPLFANIFLVFHEHCWLANCRADFKPVFFRRYIDDCFIIFRSRDHVHPFLDYLNSQHPNITFTNQLEVNSTLPFLDVLINRSDGFSTSVYRKPAFTGLFTNFDSFIPSSFKRVLVYTLLHRYFKTCFSYHFFHAEVLKCKNFLLRNGYPEAFLDRCSHVFLDRLFSPPPQDPNYSQRNVTYFTLPFTGFHSLQIRTQVMKLCFATFPHVSLRFISRSGRLFSSSFPFKERISMLLRSRVVYKYTFQWCSALYLGQTRRHLYKPISEHMGISPLTSKKLATSSLSAILTHSHKASHSFLQLFFPNFFLSFSF